MIDGSNIDISVAELNQDMSKLSQLDVVVERVDGITSDFNSIGNSGGITSNIHIKGRQPLVDHLMSDIRSDIVSDQNTMTVKEG